MAHTSPDPLEDTLDGLRRDRRWTAAALAVAACLHAAMARALPREPGARAPRMAAMQMVDLALPHEPAPPPAPPAPSPPVPSPVAPLAPPKSAPSAPSPAALARAAAVVTRSDDTREPVDLTDGFVLGAAATYGGGATAPSGASSAKAAPLASSGRAAGPAASPVLPVPASPDRSRKAAVASGAEWRCPFPREADADGVDAAVVGLRIDLDAAGAVRMLDVASDPGHGFAREARQCASRQRYLPALDREGAPQAGTLTVRVRFVR
jgi:protein TonB